MIQREDLVKIGRFRKPHGIKGEITFAFTDDLFDESENPFLICELDGIFVPFPLKEYRFISESSAFVKLKNIDSEQKAGLLTHKEVYFPKNRIKKNLSDKTFTWDYFIGFTMTDKQAGEIGLITDVDETTINTLFIIQKEEDEILIPAVSEFVASIDEEEKILYVSLPEGLLNSDE